MTEVSPFRSFSMKGTWNLRIVFTLTAWRHKIFWHPSPITGRMKRYYHQKCDSDSDDDSDDDSNDDDSKLEPPAPNPAPAPMYSFCP